MNFNETEQTAAVMELDQASATVVSRPWLDARCLPKPLYHSPFSAGQGKGNIMKGLWVKIRTG